MLHPEYMSVMFTAPAHFFLRLPGGGALALDDLDALWLGSRSRSRTCATALIPAQPPSWTDSPASSIAHVRALVAGYPSQVSPEILGESLASTALQAPFRIWHAHSRPRAAESVRPARSPGRATGSRIGTLRRPAHRTQMKQTRIAGAWRLICTATAPEFTVTAPAPT